MTSYQRRKQDVAFLEQCVQELRRLALSLAYQLGHVHAPMLLKLGSGSGLRPDAYITPYNQGEFDMELLQEHAGGKAGARSAM